MLQVKTIPSRGDKNILLGRSVFSESDANTIIVNFITKKNNIWF